MSPNGHATGIVLALIVIVGLLCLLERLRFRRMRREMLADAIETLAFIGEDDVAIARTLGLSLAEVRELRRRADADADPNA